MRFEVGQGLPERALVYTPAIEEPLDNGQTLLTLNAESRVLMSGAKGRGESYVRPIVYTLFSNSAGEMHARGELGSNL